MVQKMKIAATKIANMRLCAHRSKLIAMRRQSYRLAFRKATNDRYADLVLIRCDCANYRFRDKRASRKSFDMKTVPF